MENDIEFMRERIEKAENLIRNYKADADCSDEIVGGLRRENEKLLAEVARLRRENEGNKGDRLEGICEKISESVLRGNQIDCDP